jgi:hypothetical protein
MLKWKHAGLYLNIGKNLHWKAMFLPEVYYKLVLVVLQNKLSSSFDFKN